MASSTDVLGPLTRTVEDAALVMDIVAGRDQLDSTTIDAGQGTVEIPVVLDGKRIKLGFTGKHAIDIKTALGVAGDERSEAEELEGMRGNRAS